MTKIRILFYIGALLLFASVSPISAQHEPVCRYKLTISGYQVEAVILPSSDSGDCSNAVVIRHAATKLEYGSEDAVALSQTEIDFILGRHSSNTDLESNLLFALYALQDTLETGQLVQLRFRADQPQRLCGQPASPFCSAELLPNPQGRYVNVIGTLHNSEGEAHWLLVSSAALTTTSWTGFIDVRDTNFSGDINQLPVVAALVEIESGRYRHSPISSWGNQVVNNTTYPLIGEPDQENKLVLVVYGIVNTKVEQLAVVSYSSAFGFIMPGWTDIQPEVSALLPRVDFEDLMITE